MNSEKPITLIPYLRQEKASFEEKPFGLMDAFVFSVASYLQFENTLAYEFNESYVEDLQDTFQGVLDYHVLHSDERLYLREILDNIPKGAEGDIFWFNHLAAPFKEALMECPRYEKIRVSDITTALNPEGLSQFAAVCFHLPDGSQFVSFRGTDSTLTGWEEDLLMAIMCPIPSQRFARAYVRWLVKKWDSTLVRVGGHSKGGNLAEFAAGYCDSDLVPIVVESYSFDGPGFMQEDMELATNLGICRKYVPSESVFGKLFYEKKEPLIVRSFETGVMQHMPFSWQIIKDDFVYDTNPSLLSRITDQSFDGLIKELSYEQRLDFLAACFGILDYAAAKTGEDHVEEIFAALPSVLPSLVPQIRELDEDIQNALREVFKSFAGEVGETLMELFFRRIRE